MVPWPDILEYLRARDFIFQPSGTPGLFEFVGTLRPRQGAVSVCLQITDLDFCQYPAIRLLDENVLAGFCPHLNRHRYLCYATAGSIVLNRYKPCNALERCLQEAERTLEALLDPLLRIDESKAEFDVYWGDETWLMDQRRSSNTYLYQTQSSQLPFLSELAPTGRPAVRLTKIRLGNAPWLDAEGVPTTLAELFAWLGKVDRPALQFTRQLLRDEVYAGAGLKTLLFHSEKFDFGIRYESHSGLGSRHSKARVDHLLKTSAKIPIHRFVAKDIGIAALFARNMPALQDLREKKITLVGVGAIGGFLAQALVRLGAGAGQQGNLKLIDSDHLSVDNISRHLLGFDSIGEFKVEAVAKRLASEFPYASGVIPLAVDALQLPDIFGCDLLIDATGSESFSRALNDRRLLKLRAGQAVSPALHIWIAGNGDAVQGLLCPDAASACLMCLHEPHDDGAFKPRYPLPISPGGHRHLGCTTVTPYSVAAPMQAAALAAQMALDWLNGGGSPLFRTQFADVQLTSRWRSNRDPSPLPSCIACRS